MEEQYVDWNHPSLNGHDWVAVDEPNYTSVKVDQDGFFLSLPNEQGVGAFTVCPVIVAGVMWNSPEGCSGDMLVPSDAIIGPLPPWRESLRQRPKE